MDRRGFLRLGGLATAGLLWDPELLLWRPPKVLITVPALPVVYRGVSMSQLVAATYDQVVRERLPQDHWADESMLRCLRTNGLVRGTGA